MLLLIFTKLLCLILFINQDFINLYYFSQSYSQSQDAHASYLIKDTTHHAI